MKVLCWLGFHAWGWWRDIGLSMVAESKCQRCGKIRRTLIQF